MGGCKRKKKSLSYKMKKFAKKKESGYECNLQDDLFKYFLNISEVVQKGFDKEEDKELLATNVFQEISGHEVDVVCSSIGSRLLETILPWASNEIILKMMHIFFDNYWELASNPRASFILQSLIVITSTHAQKLYKSEEEVTSDNTVKEESSSDTEELKEIWMKMKEWVLKISKLTLNNMEQFVWLKFENHVSRTVLEVLSGLTGKDKKNNSKASITTKEKSVSEPVLIPEFCTVLEEFGERFIATPNVFKLQDMVYTDLTSGFLQVLLKALKRINKNLTKKLVTNLLNECFAAEIHATEEDEKKKEKCMLPNALPEIFMNPCASRVLEVMIQVASKTKFKAIFKKCFINRLKAFSEVPNGNFSLQVLISRCEELPQFEAIFVELSPHLENIIKMKYTGIILALAQACERMGKQTEFVKQLMIALHCSKPRERQTSFAYLVARLVPFETWERCAKLEDGEKPPIVTLHGSLILQSMLRYHNTSKVVKSLIAMNNDDLKVLICHPCGSHVVDVVFDSKTVSDKSRESLAAKLQGGAYVELACSSNGSRTLEVIWKWASVKNRQMILSDLSKKEPLINAHPIGTYIAEKFGLSLFKRRPNDWLQAQSQQIRKEKLFADIIGEC